MGAECLCDNPGKASNKIEMIANAHTLGTARRNEFVIRFLSDILLSFILIQARQARTRSIHCLSTSSRVSKQPFIGLIHRLPHIRAESLLQALFAAAFGHSVSNRLPRNRLAHQQTHLAGVGNRR